VYKQGNWLRAVIAFVAAEAVMVAGYFLLETAMYGLAVAAAAVGPNIIQGVAGVALGLACVALEPRLRKIVK